MLKFFLLLLIPISAFSAPKILPDLQTISCSSSESKHASFWFELMAGHIDQLIEKSELTGIEADVFKNQLVTLSYAGLYNSSQNNSSTSLMGYVYANASHHLGRLVRYRYWDKFPGEILGEHDRSLVTGDLLGTTVRTFPVTLSRRLMSHSLDLYKTLSWSLVARTRCGQVHILKLLNEGGPVTFPGLAQDRYEELHQLLKQAHLETSLTEFMNKFVTFEQTYLQYTMYAKPDIRIPTSMGMLDKMRFIPFNGEKNISFYEWCKNSACDTTSLNLKLRILFDQEMIKPEIQRMSSARIRNTKIFDVADFIFEDFCHSGRISGELCP